MKATVVVTLRAQCEVEIEVEHEEDEDPRSLTDAEEAAAIAKGDGFPEWEVRSVFSDVRVKS